MRRIFLFLLFPVLFLASCSTAEKPKEAVNPLLVEFETPFGAPPFDIIGNEHYLPAYTVAIEEHKADIQAIVNNPEAPDFENTIVAYDRSGKLMSKISPIFGGLRGANTNPRLQELAREITPMLSAHSNEIRFNQGLFERIKTVYEQRESLGLNQEQMRLTEKIYQDFARNGAALPEEQREELKSLNQQMSMLSLKLGENLLAENNGFKLVLDKQEDLAGLPQNVVAAAADEAKKSGMEGKWIFTLAKPSWIPFLQFSERRDLREKLYTAYINRGDNNNENDNKATFLELMEMRKKMANLLGYDNYAAYFIADQMAETPANVYDFLYQVWEPSIKRAKLERDEQQAIIKKTGGDFKLASWDWWYYSEMVRKEKYDLNEDDIKPYFAIENVKNGIFILTNKLFGLTYVKNTEIPVYHPEVEAYEVFNR
ncbi:MAG: M3 family metallopeptidase, partial [Bacteroidales bacterium]|nr:M3 family metallopeptidase [Bacteroidales bacterium]